MGVHYVNPNKDCNVYRVGVAPYRDGALPASAAAAERQNAADRSTSSGIGSVFDQRYSDNLPTIA